MSGKANSSHTHNYLPLTGGTLSGTVYLKVIQNDSANDLNLISNSSNVYIRTYGGLYVTNPAANGYKPINASDFNNMSSKNTKDNIRDITDEEAQKLLDVNVVSFDYKENFGGKKNNFGVVAEQVKDVVPYVVTIPNNYSEDEFDEEKGINQPILSVDYTKFVPYLIKMVQIQQSKINELEERLSKLENN